jgi:hypothetical protein
MPTVTSAKQNARMNAFTAVDLLLGNDKLRKKREQPSSSSNDCTQKNRSARLLEIEREIILFF